MPTSTACSGERNGVNLAPYLVDAVLYEKSGGRSGGGGVVPIEIMKPKRKGAYYLETRCVRLRCGFAFASASRNLFESGNGKINL